MTGNAHLGDTIAAVSTPPGTGGLAVIRVSGSDAIAISDTVFSGNLSKAGSHTIHYGQILYKGEDIDEVMASVFRSPKSFTTEDTVEISCHGSLYIQQRIMEALIDGGARRAEPGEFSMRAFLHGRLDLTQAEAVTDIIASGNKRAHELAMRQLKGGFAKAIGELRASLIHFASMIELELDFGEEDVEFADRGQLVELIDGILKQINPLMDSFQLGNAIKHGIVTVIAGRPNAGKSTLLNGLLNEERAIVSDIEGTTRDTIEEILNINGIAFRIIDTAGIREARDQIEAIGVEKTYAEVERSAILIYVYDQAALPVSEVLTDLSKLNRDPAHTVVVANKHDLFDVLPEAESDVLQGREAEQWEQLEETYHVVEISAKRQDGLDILKEKLYELVSAGGHEQDDIIISNIRHYEALMRTSESLNAALNGIHGGISGDIVAMDIRHAIRYLGEITGEITTDDLLENIFSRFCIGK